MLSNVKSNNLLDEHYMLVAIDEAIHALRANPTYGSQVGCILLGEDESIISHAHNNYSHDVRMHAEEIVLKGVDDTDLSTVTLYTTAEPCNGNPYHKRKHCCEQIVDAGISRVVIGTLKKRYEGGSDYMKNHGIKVNVNKNIDLSHICRLLLYSCVKGQHLSKRTLNKILNSREKIDVALI